MCLFVDSLCVLCNRIPIMDQVIIIRRSLQGMDLPDICQFSYNTAFYRPFNSRKSSQNRLKGTPPPIMAIVTNISYDWDGEQSAGVVCKIHQSLLSTSPPFLHSCITCTFEEVAQQRFFVFQYSTFILLFQ